MCDDIIALTVNRICARAFLCLKFFSIFISSMVNLDRYNPLKQELFVILNNF